MNLLVRFRGESVPTINALDLREKQTTDNSHFFWSCDFQMHEEWDERLAIEIVFHQKSM
jgi:hypothetical protein